MKQHNPPHPGGFIYRTYLEPHDISAQQVAEHLGISHSHISRIIAEQDAVTPDLAIRLSRVLGRSPQSWLQMQMNYDLWRAEQAQPHKELKKLELA